MKNNPLTSEKIFDAIELANKLHRGQFRKTTPIPKLVHLIGVMGILLEHGCSKEVAIAGLLHDSLEDTQLTTKDIANKFGRKIAKFVEGASEKDKSLSWEKRKQQTLEYLKNAPIEIALIVCADKLDNFRFTRREYEKIGDRVWDRFNRGKKEQKWYFQSILRVLKKRLKKDPGKSMVKDLESEIKKVFI